MKKYQVGNIKFSFNYHYNKYFANNIEKYEIASNSDVNHHINVIIASDIKQPKGEVIGVKSPYVIINDKMRYSFYKNEANYKIRVLISHDLLYENINIYLNEAEINDMANAEYVFSGIIFLELAEYLGYLPVHASAIMKNEDVFLFSAPSGTGKSTHRKYWQELYSNVEVINDDKPLLSFDNNKITVIGSPFSGAEHINVNKAGNLKAIVFLKQGLNNNIRELSKDEKIKELIRNTVTPKLNYLWEQVLFQIETIINKTPIIELSATNNYDAVKTINKYFKEKLLCK